MCSVQPGAESGNVIVVLQQENHETFTRRGHDLYMTQKVGMTEALCGMQFVVRQLDGRDLLLRNPPGNVIEPGMHVCDVISSAVRMVFFISNRIESNS